MSAMTDLVTDFNESNCFTYMWIIENMCTPCFLTSPKFTVQATDATTWELMLSCRPTGCIDVILTRMDEVETESVIDVKCELSFLGINGFPLIREVSKRRFENKDGLWFVKFCEKNYVFNRRRAEFIPNDTLTIRCRMWMNKNEVPNPDLCYARTVLRMEMGSFVWSIREFSSLQPGHKKSTVINPTAKEEFQWRLCFSVEELHGEQYLSIKILLDDDNEYFCFYKIKMQLLDVSGEVVYTSEDAGNPENLGHFENFFEKRVLMANKASLLPNDLLSMRCEFGLLEIVWNRIDNDRSLKLEEPLSETQKVKFGKRIGTSAITEAIKSLLVKGTLSDVNLQTGSRSFEAHKCILSSRSPVFDSMFNRDIEEKTSNCVEIPGIDEDTMRRLLSYIYTDSVEDLQWQEAADLYRAADEYQLLDLKSICSTTLKSNICASNFCSVLVFGDMQQDLELLEAVQNFIMRQEVEFLESETWQNFKVEHPQLALEELERIVYNMKIQQEGC